MSARLDDRPTGLSGFARKTIDELALSPHPEGGWYRRTWQSPLAAEGGMVPAAQGEDAVLGPRPLASLICFLLPAGDASAWHKVDADEIWLWHGPGTLALELGGTGEAPVTCERHLLGMDAGASPQLLVPAGVWQRTVPGAEDVLVSCVVSPGFVYRGFRLDEPEGTLS